MMAEAEENHDQMPEYDEEHDVEQQGLVEA
jgi:hypothetical protein